MTDPVTHVTIATSTGVLRLALLAHFGAGLVGLVSGFLGLAVTKGGRVHRLTGRVFVYAMITTGLMAAGIAAYEGKLTMVVGGSLTAYLVFTAVTTVRPLAGDRRALNIGLMMAAFVLALSEFAFGFKALGNPKGMIDGVAYPMVFFMATVVLVAALGDLRMIRDGGIKGARRLARHLWRMCFGLFIASGSFFLGQMKFLPKSLRIMPLLGVLALAPIAALLYWMWRVRVRQSLRGIVTINALNERKLA